MKRIALLVIVLVALVGAISIVRSADEAVLIAVNKYGDTITFFDSKTNTKLATIRVPEEGSVEVRQTTQDQEHFTIYAEPEAILALVEGEPTLIPGAPGD